MLPVSVIDYYLVFIRLKNNNKNEEKKRPAILPGKLFLFRRFFSFVSDRYLLLLDLLPAIRFGLPRLLRMAADNWIHPSSNLGMVADNWIHPSSDLGMVADNWIHPSSDLGMVADNWIHPSSNLGMVADSWIHPSLNPEFLT